MTKTIAALAAFAAIGSSASAIDFSNFSITGTVAYESEYIFRGVETDDEAFQPSVEISFHGLETGTLYTGLWASQGISNTTGLNEIDYYAGYTFELADYNTAFDLGVTFYTYDDSAAEDTTEIYLGLAWDTTDLLNGVNLSPAVYFFYDFDYEALTVEFSGGYAWDLSKYVANSKLAATAYLGFVDANDANAGIAGSPSNGWTYFGGALDYVYTFTDTASASIGVRYAENNDGGPNEENFWWGASFSAGF